MIIRASIISPGQSSFALYLPASPRRKVFGYIYTLAGLVLLWYFYGIGSQLDEMWLLAAFLLSLPALLIVMGLTLLLQEFPKAKSERRYLPFVRLVFDWLTFLLFTVFMLFLAGVIFVLYGQYERGDAKIISLLDGSPKSIVIILMITVIYAFFVLLIFPSWWRSLRVLWSTIKHFLWVRRYTVILNETPYNPGDNIKVRFPNFKGQDQRIFLNLVDAVKRPSKRRPNRTFYYSAHRDVTENQMRSGIELGIPVDVEGRQYLDTNDKQYWEILIESHNKQDWFRYGIHVG